jgi:hypothetical protein
MRTAVLFSAITITLMVAAGYAPAQPISVLGGNPLIQVTAGAAPADPMTAINTSSSLQWRRQNKNAKITVATSCPGQRFTLRVYAVTPSEGVAAPEVTLTNGMPAVNFIINCPAGGPRLNTAILRYTASATFSQGNSTEIGNDVHLVTYTILAQ